MFATCRCRYGRPNLNGAAAGASAAPAADVATSQRPPKVPLRAAQAGHCALARVFPLVPHSGSRREEHNMAHNTAAFETRRPRRWLWRLALFVPLIAVLLGGLWTWF